MSRPRRCAAAASVLLATAAAKAVAPIEVGFLWHMHQPIYYPGENIIQTTNANRYSFSLYDVHNQRFGPYTTWPRDAVQIGSGLPNLGTQVSFSGSLVENLNNLKNAGINGGMWNGWNGAYTQAKGWNTTLGNTRMDMIGFTYHHALGPLLDERDLRMQIKMHKISMQNTFGGAYSKGFFPAETAFSERMIPALVAEGLEWTLVDNIHIDRATKTYPHSNASGMIAPNKADQINPAPAAWVQLNNLWAPTKVGAPDGYRPAWVQHVNPNTGEVKKIVAVPAARYEGNEDGRGGYGAFLYGTVMDQYRQYNTDPARPMFVMLHHDGDNYGGGSEAYYHSNFQNMVNWDQGTPNYNVSTVQDYLERFPVPQNALIHVAPGSWAGADSGDPEFKKWLGDPNGSGWSPDRNSWAVLTAAKNRVFTAEDLTAPANPQNVINNAGTAAEKAWHYLVQAEASDHWYWDGTEIWDSNVTRGSNLAATQANVVLNSHQGSEATPPTVFQPQRDSYNPGEFEFSANRESSDFKVWTYAYDVSGLQSVTLKWRVDGDGENPLNSTQNETFAGGSEVGSWNSAAMSASDVLPPGNILQAQYRAMQYSANVNGQNNALIDYYVEAVDQHGNITRSEIQHVWVGQSTVVEPPPGGGNDFTLDGALDPDATLAAQNGGMKLHYGRKGNKLYLATNDAGESNDHFIYLARNPGAMVPANWAKAGQIAQWDAYLADENDNDYEAWTGAIGAAAAATGPNGGVLEGTLDLIGQYGFIPSEIYVAVGLFPTANGTALLHQYGIPVSSDGDGNINAADYLKIVLGNGWATQGSGTWSVASNWFDGAIPNSTGAHARFLGVLDSPATVYANAATTVGQITFDSASTYTLAGTGSLMIDVGSGSGSINVIQGQHQINLPVMLNDNTTATVGAGAKLSIGAPLTIASGTTLTTGGAGTFELAGSVSGATGAGIKVTGGFFDTSADLNGADVQVDTGTARFKTSQHLASLSVAAGAAAELSNEVSTSILKTGSISPLAGTLEIHDNALIVDYGGSPNAVLTTLRTALSDGKLVSSGLSSDRAIGYADAVAVGITGSFLGESIDTTAVVARFTLKGDANLDLKVDTVDFNLLAGGFDGGDAWQEGDFNHDGVVSSLDFNAFVLNYGSSLPVAMAPLGVVVPEPAIMSLVALGGLSLRRRR